MNKQELDNLTKHESTWEEFAAIERLYMAAQDMTKAEAAKLWRRCFLGAALVREAAYGEPANKREGRGFLNPDGTPAVVTRLRVRCGGREAVATKTKLGEYFRARIDRLDEDGAEFWEDRDAPNHWILADVFAI